MCNSIPYYFRDEENSESHQMDSPVSVSSSNDDGNRVKLLCSFLGSIMPRPQDGKLRYVGGETRIISLPRTISYEELMSKMKELYESASVLKYQQPDEDLDALVSVVNDDDVVNMMEEYEKLGSGDGFTRLRIFLFPNQDSMHYIEGDDRETERRYVDALNNLNDGRQHMDSSLEDFSVHDAFYEGLMHSQRSNDVSLPQYSLRHVAAPQIYSDSDGQWSPAYYSPRHYGGMLDPRTVSEFPNSPPRYCMQYAEFQDVCGEEFARTHGVHHSPYEQAPPFPDSFPGNLFPNGFEGGNNFEHSRSGLHRNQIHAEQHNAANQFNHHAAFTRDQNEGHAVFNESHPQDRGWVLQHQNSPRAEDSRIHNPFPPRFSDQSIMEGHAVNYPASHHVPSGFVHHRGRVEMGNEVMHEQGFSPAHHVPFSAHDERSGWFGNYPYCEGFGPMAQLNSHLHPHWKNVQHGIHTNVASDTSVHANSARMCSGIEGHHQYGESSQKLHKFDANSFVDYHNGQVLSVERSKFDLENRQIIPFNPVQHYIASDGAISSNLNSLNNQRNSKTTEQENGALKNSVADRKECSLCEAESVNDIKHLEETDGNPEDSIDDSLVAEGPEPSLARLSFVPELIASLKKATLEEKDVEEQTAKSADKNSNTGSEEAVDEHDKVNKIEPTKAEAEAIERGLQTIRNEDLEEIRELGSGTYGAVYHGKWKGSDVAIKRIKASCFAGRPSERDRLIADFWKEALILSSLHHPNVVSFYGIVRDGLNGSLATVTEFMVNGSLKQFLQKKDRTIDRRKRLIIVMDAAFGMEYLHGKNIVHFDLKCENLLVNMRDPHRPICKIGDLGLSKVKQQTLVSGGVRGTLPWMAPELLSGKSHMVSEKIDVYSFGIVMWELLTGDEPYAGMHCASIIGGIVNNTLRPEIPSWCDPEWRSLMEMCWASDPSVRPSFSQVSTALRSMAAAINLK